MLDLDRGPHPNTDSRLHYGTHKSLYIDLWYLQSVISWGTSTECTSTWRRITCTWLTSVKPAINVAKPGKLAAATFLKGQNCEMILQISSNL